MRATLGGLLVVAVALGSCGKPRPTYEVERTVTIVSPPPAGAVTAPLAGTVGPAPSSSVTTTPPSDKATGPPTTVPPPAQRPSSWLRGEKR